MQVNGAMSSEVYNSYKSTQKTTITEQFTLMEREVDGGKETTITKQSTYTSEVHQEILSSGVNRELPMNSTSGNTRPLGMGFLLVGDFGYGMSATQLDTGSDDVVVRVKIAKGNDEYDTVDVNLSQLDTRNATAVEMFAYCQYADANGTGVAKTNSMFGSWNALKSVVSPYDGMNFGSYDEAVNTRRDWNQAVSKSKAVFEKQSTGETLTAADVIEMFKKNHELTAGNIDETDWRYMSDEDWERLLKDVDNYFDAVNEQLEQLKKIQQEAAMKAANDAPADMKTIAASMAALSVASNGFSSGNLGGDDASWIKENSWTYDLQTDDQEILATAKAANDAAKDALSKSQEIGLTGSTTAGISNTENVKECASPSENESKEKEWIITAFGDQGIICKRCSMDGKSETLWTFDYKNSSDAKKVWDFLDRFEKETDLKFAGNKSFWEDFLEDKVDIQEVLRQYNSL